MQPVPLFLGGFLVGIGGFAVWTATAGAEWNSTHNRALQRTPRVSRTQRKINKALGLTLGPVLIVFGFLSIVLGAR